LRSIFDDAVKIFTDEKTASGESEKRKERREEADLVAQEGMAKWAKWLLIVAAVQLPLGGLTLFFLYRTFKENKRTADAAVQAAAAAAKGNEQNRLLFVAEQRPWLHVTVLVIGPLRFDADGINMRGHVTIENTGKSPAENVWQRWEFLPDAKVARVRLQAIAAEQLNKRWSDTARPGELLFPGRKLESKPTFKIARSELPPIGTEITTAIIGCVTYQTSIMKDRLQIVYFTEIQGNAKPDRKRTFTVIATGETPVPQMRFKGTFVRDSGIAGAGTAEDDE
jgi:hypothetical protein